MPRTVKEQIERMNLRGEGDERFSFTTIGNAIADAAGGDQCTTNVFRGLWLHLLKAEKRIEALEERVEPSTKEMDRIIDRMDENIADLQSRQEVEAEIPRLSGNDLAKSSEVGKLRKPGRPAKRTRKGKK